MLGDSEARSEKAMKLLPSSVVMLTEGEESQDTQIQTHGCPDEEATGSLLHRTENTVNVP